MRELLYILSPSYSGSTLLTLLLAQHPDVTTIGELKGTAMGPLEDYTCSCGEKIQACDFWQQMVAKVPEFRLEQFGTHFRSENAFHDRVLRAQVRGPLFESLRRLALLWPSLAKRYRKVQERNRQFIEVACEAQAGRWFLDGSKDPHRLAYLKDSNNYRIKVIEMYRDGRAQSHSQRKKNYHGGSFARACEEWKSTIAQMQRVLRRFNKNDILRVKYEDLCSDPNQVMANIQNFLGVPIVEQNWSSVNLRQVPHHIIGNNMRTKDDISIRLDNAWLDDLTQEDKKTFETIAGSTNHQLGYAS